MNRVYKVIWSKAKHCYVVTSEIAKSHTKGETTGKGLKKLAAAMLVAAALLSPSFAWAADTVTVKDAKNTDVVQTVYTQKGADDTFVKNESLNQYVSKDDAVVQDIGVVKADQNIGSNVSALGKGLDDAKNALSAAEAGIKTLTEACSHEEEARKASDAKLVEAVNSGITLSNENVLQKNTTTVNADGNVTTSKTDVNEMILKGTVKGATLTDGTATLQNGNLNTTGNVNAHDIVATGNVNAHDIVATGDISGRAITGTSLNTQGGAINGGAITGTSINGTTGTFGSLSTTGNASVGGTLTTHGITNNGNAITDTLTVNHNATVGGDLGVTGDITGKSLNVGTGDIKGGQITGTRLNVGAGTIKTTGAVETGTLTTTGDAAIGGNLTVGTNLTVNGEFNSKTLSSKLDENNYTTINGGNVKSEVNDKVGTVDYSAESTFNKDGSSITVRTDEGIVDSTGKSIVGAKEISQYLGDNAKPESSQKNVTRKMVRNDDGTFSMEDKAVDGKNKYSTVNQTETGIKSTATDGKNTASTNLSNNGFNTFASDGTNKTYTKQTAKSLTSQIGDDDKVKSVMNADGITNNADGGTITNDAKYLVNKASGDMTNTVGGKLLNDVTGDMENKVGGKLTTTVTGDSSLTAENIKNEAKNKITNTALDVETDAKSSIVNKVSNDAGSNTSTQLSYQTTEEMSQADGKTASYLRGAAEEKSQLTDGAKKTTIDTIAGQTNTNITEGKNISNSLQKADQAASSVTDGTNTTVVNQDAKSLASSITDGTGTKVNNSFHWVNGSAQRIEVDDTHFYAETRTAETAVETLKSGKTQINIVKDTNTATVSSAVTDEATITGISQNAKDISLSAAGGTITNDANDVLNKGANSVINEVGANQVAVMTDSVKAAYGSDTYTTWNGNGITSNTSGNMSNSAKNITNKATEKLSNSATDIENKASSSIWNHVGEGYNTSWKMTDGKISESIVKGTASNKENTTAEGTKRIITNDEGTGTYNQTATSNNISLKNAAEDTSFTKSESLDGEKTSVTNPNGSSTINQSAESIVKFVKNSEGTTKTEQSAKNITNTAKNGTITNDAKDVLNKASESITDKVGDNVERTMTTEQIQDKVGKTTVTTTDGLTKLTNEDGNHETEMDNANVLKDLSVGGNATVGMNLEVKGTSTLIGDVTMESNATVNKDLTVKGASEFVGRADFRNDVYMWEDLEVTGETRTGTLYVNKDGYVGGDLNVVGNIETHDAELSADSRQVVTGRQLYRTNERVDKLDNRIKKVGANAAALAALRPGDFNPDDKFSIAAGFGSYRNASAAALGLFYRPNENVILSLGTSFGDGENMVNAGVSVKFGRGKSMAERRKEMAEEVSVMRDEMKSQNDRIAELEEMLKKQSELIEKLSKES